MSEKKVDNKNLEENESSKDKLKSSSSKKSKQETKAGKAFKKLEKDYHELQGKYETAILETQFANEKMLRVVAEYDNMKKRQAKESIRVLDYEKMKMAKSLLPVVDNLERSAAFTAKEANVESMSNGTKLVLEMFLKILKDEFEVVAFESLDCQFNPEKHDAMTMIASDKKSGIIIEEYEKGYYLGEVVLRHAKVAVSE